MTGEEAAARVAEFAREDPDAVSLDAIEFCLDSGSTAVRARAAEALGHLALSGRDVAGARDRLDALLADVDALAEPAPLSVEGREEQVFQPRAVAFGVAALALSGRADPASLLRLALRAYERRYPEFDADARGYAAVGDLGWALASVVILTDDYGAELCDLAADPDPLIRRVATAGLSDVAEEYAPVRGESPPNAADLADAAAERLADEPDDRVRYRAAFALYEFGLRDPDVVRGRVEVLCRALDDEYALVRREAAGALGVLGGDAVDGADADLAVLPDDAVAALRALTDDPDPRVREAASAALGDAA